jgi:hypothetical protein
MMTDSRRTAVRVDRSRRCQEGGYAAVLTALVLVPLLGFAGFAVDIGAWYSRASSLQRAADAAALAGVVWQPDFSEAESAARAEAARNGFTHGVDGVTVTVTDTGDNQIEIEIIDADADLYFAGLFLDNVTIGRQSIAEYNEPVAMGSPDNTLGHQMPDGCNEVISPSSSCAGAGPGWFLDVGGPLTAHTAGEPVTTQCLGGYGASCNFLNPDYDPSGYVFAIDVPQAAVGSAITVQVFDPSHYNGGGKQIPTWGGDGSMTVLEFSVFEADGIGLTTPETTAVSGCTKVYDAVYDVTEEYVWNTLCTFIPTVADLYPLRIRTEGFTGANTSRTSLDGFSMRALSASGTQPSLYALEFLPMFSNAPSVTTLTFAEIVDEHAGKTIRMRLFDAGDSSQSGTFTLTPLDPDGNPVGSCQYRFYKADEDPTAATWHSSDNNTQCEVITRIGSTSLYNDKWLDIDIDIPIAHSCTYCWWSVFYSLPSGVSFYERTVWTVLIVGDPVHLLE